MDDKTGVAETKKPLNEVQTDYIEEFHKWSRLQPELAESALELQRRERSLLLMLVADLTAMKTSFTSLQDDVRDAKLQARSTYARAEVAERRAIAAEESAVTATSKANDAERRAIAAEESAVAATYKAEEAERRAIAAEESAVAATSKAEEAERRAIAAEESAVAANSKAGEAERRAIAAEESAVAANSKAGEAERRAIAADAKANEAERRAIAAEGKAEAVRNGMHAFQWNNACLELESLTKTVHAMWETSHPDTPLPK
jgi:chromosome segregation ATPase